MRENITFTNINKFNKKVLGIHIRLTDYVDKKNYRFGKVNYEYS